MQILAVCTYCGKGKVKATSRHVGQSVVCPVCKISFTIAGPDESAKYRAGDVPGRADEDAVSASSVLVNSRPSAPAGDTARSGAAANSAPPVAPVVRQSAPVFIPSAMPSGDDREPSMAPALLACTIGGLAMLATQFPYGRWIALGLGAVGLVVGAMSLMASDQERRYPLAGTGLNLFVLFMVLLLPDWLGLRPVWEADRREDPSLIKAVDPTTGLGIVADWVDAGKSAWRQDDVQIKIGSVVVGRLEVLGPKSQKLLTKDRYLQIPVTIENVGVSRKIDFVGWTQFGPVPDAIKLTDQSGKAVESRKLDPTLTPTFEMPELSGLFFGKLTQQTLLFEVPDRTATSLKLELPASAFGGRDPVRLLIPGSMLNWR